jgi:hypothetical protein
MHIVSDDTLRNSEASPSTPPTSEPPTDVTELAVWINVETQRDLKAIREAVLICRAAVDQLTAAITQRLEFWEGVIAKAPQRRASPRSHTFVPTGVVAGFASDRVALLEDLATNVPDDFEADLPLRPPLGGE